MPLGESLRRQGVETSASGVFLGRSSNGAGEVEEVPTATVAALVASALDLPAFAGAPIEVEGVRDDPEEALANLLTALAALGLITDSTTET